ncbi:MAG: hypothetical protein JWO08_1491 [Verrucomicrobiaceae bacterium]|nr:hypothetical protein [Verrucomicrobiaceae bacterium]
MKANVSTVAKEQLSRELFEPLLLADWSDAVFLHYAVKPEVLQPFVPFPLDLREGMAYVSLVAFTMSRMRPRRGGKWSEALFKPIATHEFLNLRTYITHKGDPGIYFLAEWLPNKLSVKLGPPVFGLPYRHGQTHYEHDREKGFTGTVIDSDTKAALRYIAAPVAHAELEIAEKGSLTEFLLERYSAFTTFLGLKRRFRVWHPAWQHVTLKAAVYENSLMALTGAWAQEAQFAGAHYAPGFRDIWMGRPRLV